MKEEFSAMNIYFSLNHFGSVSYGYILRDVWQRLQFIISRSKHENQTVWNVYFILRQKKGVG